MLNQNQQEYLCEVCSYASHVEMKCSVQHCNGENLSQTKKKKKKGEGGGGRNAKELAH